ncbi:MAG: hypothetical protein ABIB71_04955 [Candidatus Woesearchaeota archaeon]
MRKSHAIALILILIFLTVGIVSFSSFFYNTLAVKEFKTTLIVGDHFGFDVGTEVLAMGMVKPGSSSTSRKLVLENSYEFPVKVSFVKEGQMKDWLIIEDEVIIPAGSTTDITVAARVPLGTPYGDYEGKLVAIFTRA